MVSINPVRGPHVAAAGRVCHVLHPDPAVFRDYALVAHALSHINRYSGNVGTYSVAQHAVTVSLAVEMDGGSITQQLAALHHDDSEIVIGDVPQPVKALCPSLIEIERLVHNAINVAHQIDVEDSLVKHHDYQVFLNEVYQLVPKEHRDIFQVKNAKGEMELLPHPDRYISSEFFRPWKPSEAAQAYMARHEQLWHYRLMEAAQAGKGAEA